MAAAHMRAIGCLSVAAALGTPCVRAATKAPPPPPPLSEAGQKLEARYAALLAERQAEVSKAVPAVDEQKKAAYLKAREAELAAEGELAKRQKALDDCRGAAGLLEHRKNWVAKSIAALAELEKKLKDAATDEARKAAQEALDKERKNKATGEEELKKSLEAAEKAKTEEPKLAEDLAAAQAALAQARSDTLKVIDDLGLNAFLASDALDAQLVRFVVLSQATPRGLAEFAQQGEAEAALVEKLLADDALMERMLVADGAKGGRYGRAMEIYTAIRQASPRTGEGVFQRLALGVSLEHAIPVKQSNPQAETNAPAFVDPVKRYLHYEKAYLDGELDPGFQTLTAWDYRMAVNGDEPDATLAWGREMLRNYRPDHVHTADYRWRYVKAVKTEVKYGSGDTKNDIPTMQSYQNIVNTGGVCGRRAFFGRFILRCFGIPTWGVTQHAHAALSHWTPKGWVVNLGAGFPSSWWDKDEAPRSGSDFLLETQARAVPGDYLKVLRAQWISAVLGEPAYNDRRKVDGGFWSGLAYFQARAIATAAKAVALGPLGQELGEANESPATRAMAVESAAFTEADQKPAVGPDGTIAIPAVAHGKATGPSAAVKSFSGGMQMHCSGGFKTQYAFEAPRPGKYALTARVATVQAGQAFLFAANDAKAPVEVGVPHTVGLWQRTPPAEVSLVAGKNVLQFEVKAGSRGVTIKEFVLTPVK